MWRLLRIVGWLIIALGILYTAEAVAARVAGRGEPVYMLTGVVLLIAGFVLKAVSGSKSNKDCSGQELK